MREKELPGGGNHLGRAWSHGLARKRSVAWLEKSAGSVTARQSIWYLAVIYWTAVMCKACDKY